MWRKNRKIKSYLKSLKKSLEIKKIKKRKLLEEIVKITENNHSRLVELKTLVASMHIELKNIRGKDWKR